MKIKEKARELYQSPDYFIKYSGGKPIACHPFYAGGSFSSMGAEKPCNNPQEAKQVLRNVALRHAEQIQEDQFWEATLDNNNKWEVLLRETCEAVLKRDIDADEYTEAVLDEMHTGEAYQSQDGTPHYYEIPAIDTASGRPVVVRL